MIQQSILDDLKQEFNIKEIKQIENSLKIQFKNNEVVLVNIPFVYKNTIELIEILSKRIEEIIKY